MLMNSGPLVTLMPSRSGCEVVELKCTNTTGLRNDSAVNAYWPIDINLLLWSLFVLGVENECNGHAR